MTIIKTRQPNGIELSSGEAVFTNDFALTNEILSRDKNLVAIFGGGRISPSSPYFQKARSFAELIAKAGVSVITGGGPGIMQAGNMGAKLANPSVPSFGLNVESITDEDIGESQYIDQDCRFVFKTLSVRLLTLISVSKAIVFFPGGFGTLEELFSLLVRIHVNMMNRIPVYLVGTEFWRGLIDWLSAQPLGNNAISKSDFDLFRVEDDVNKIAAEIISSINGSN